MSLARTLRSRFFQCGDLGRVRNRRGNVREKNGGWSPFLSGDGGAYRWAGYMHGVRGSALGRVEARAGTVGRGTMAFFSGLSRHRRVSGA